MGYHVGLVRFPVVLPQQMMLMTYLQLDFAQVSDPEEETNRAR
jgi:hypothetical protein